MNSMRLYLRYLGVSIRAQMQYRASFVMLSIGGFLAVGIEIAGIWALFERFGSLRGWVLADVAVLFGVINIALAVGDAFGRGFDVFARMIVAGDFDRLLLRPRSTALQVAAQELTLFRFGKAAQGVLVLLWGAGALGVDWTPARIALAVCAVAGGVCLFVGLWVLQATLAFWTTESLEVMNAFTYGGCETGQFPMPIYRPWFRTFFTFVIPISCVSYLPVLTILGRDGGAGWQGWLSPLVGAGFLLVCLRVWRVGVRHYRSSGS